MSFLVLLDVARLSSSKVTISVCFVQYQFSPQNEHWKCFWRQFDDCCIGSLSSILGQENFIVLCYLELPFRIVTCNIDFRLRTGTRMLFLRMLCGWLHPYPLVQLGKCVLLCSPTQTSLFWDVLYNIDFLPRMSARK